MSSVLKTIAFIINMPEDEVMNHPYLLVNVFDLEHRILFWNYRCEQYFHIGEEEALGKILEELIPSTRNNKKMIHLQKALWGYPVYIANDEYDRKKGIYDQVVLPLKDADGHVFAAVNIVVDLTVMKSIGNRKFSFFSNNIL